MKTWTFIIVLLWAVLPISAAAQNQNSAEGDRQALVDLYNSTDGDNWSNNSGWLDGNPSNDWYGVEVDADGRVVRLKLNGTGFGQEGIEGGNNLVGTLPESLGNLKRLTYFNVKNNYMRGEIPESIGNIASLEHLLLSGLFHDPVPVTGSGNHSTKADWPDLTNDFSGELPSSIGNLTNLIVIEITHINQFTPGLTGAIPESLNNLVNLRYLQIGRNAFTSLPDLSGLQSLESISLSANIALEGQPWPAWLGNIPPLRFFTFQGIEWAPSQIPDLSALTDLQRFSTDRANFTGTIPDWLTDGTFSSINEIYLSWNDLEGELPEFANMGLIAFTVSGNNLTGEIPDSFWMNNQQIKSTNFGWNNFTGMIKADGDLRFINNIRNLRFPNNNFEGQWPDLDWTNQQGLTLNDGVTPHHPLGSFSRAQFSGNKFVFRDMLVISDEGKTLFQWYAEEAEAEFWYKDQKPFGSTVSINVGEGSEVLLDHFDGNVSHPDNVYQWQKDGVDISGATTKNLTLSNVDASDEGVYKLIVTNTLHDSLVETLRGTYPEVDEQGFLVLESEPIEVSLGSGGDDSTEVPSTPSLQTPSSGASNVSVNPTFSWSSVSADSYTLRVYSSGGTLVFENTGSGTSYSTPSSRTLAHDTEYSWRVRATRDGMNSDWSSSRTFRTEASDDGGSGGDDGGSGGDDGDDDPGLAAPVQLSPEGDAENVSLTPDFTWNSVEGADSYILHANRLDPSEMVIEVTVEGTSYTPGDSLDAETVHHWRVRAVKEGVEGEWSPVREFTTESDEEIDNNLSEDNVSLEQNFPNPFNPSTQIRFSVAESQQVSLKVYDMAGRLINTLVEGSVTAGTHQATFNGNNLSSGIYFYRLITEQEVVTLKMTFLK